MHLETQLTILASFAAFLLKSSLGFCICWALAKAAVEARRKFLVWFSFLAIAAIYWLWMLQSLFRQSLTVAQNATGPVSAAPLAALQISHSWLAPLAILTRALAILYLVTLAYFTFARIKKHLHLRWILRFTSRPPEHIENIFRPIAETLGVPNVRLLVLPGIYSPATFGWIKPTVVIPILCLDQEMAELKDIFRHELQHIRRHDSIFSSLAALFRSLLFFHPAVSYAMRRLTLESELACDVAVVGDSPEKRASYAECLMRFARLRLAGEAAPWDLDFAGSSSQLKLRIRSILTLNRTVPRRMIIFRGIIGVLLLVGFVTAAPSLFVVLSIQQPSSIHPPARATSAPVQELRLLRHAVPARRARISPQTVTPLAETPAAQPEQMVAQETPSPEVSRTRRSTAGDPTLKTRGTSQFPAGATIPLSEPPSYSSDSSSKRESIASAIAAGAGEAARVSSHGRDREVH